jgi:phage terminase large subunit-like protein
MKYYQEVINLVDSGKPISEEVGLALKRVPHYIKVYKYNHRWVSRIISFIEKNMWLQKGGDRLIKLEPEQKFWIEMMGFEHDDGRPVITDLPVIIGAGSGKSTFLACLSIAVMMVGSKRGQDVLVFANSKLQAQELFRTAQEIVRDERSNLYEFYKRDLLRPIINKIDYPVTDSSIQIKAMDNRTADGVNVRMIVFDEFHAYTTNIIENVRKSTANKRKDTGYTIFYSSTNGQTRGATFDSYISRWEKILHGEIEDDAVFPIIYKLDDISEVLNPDMYEKALPFINSMSDKSITKNLVTQAEGNPVAQAEILAKVFNIPQEQYNALFTEDVIKHSREGFKKIPRGARVYVGYDLSAVYDLSVICFVYHDESTDSYYIDGHGFIPRSTYENKISRELKERYTRYVDEGTLTLVDTPMIESSEVAEYTDNFLSENGLILEKVLGDAFYKADFQKMMKDAYGKDIIKTVKQSVANLSEPLKVIRAYVDNKKLFLASDIIAWNFTNLRVKVDANGNIFPNKDKARAQIDFVSAATAAFSGILNSDDSDIIEYKYE